MSQQLPTIKKTRKRADARQLEVLNSVYDRTAFPSTEERAAIAKELDMSARVVCKFGWLMPFVYSLFIISYAIGHYLSFQNKRQSMRQGGRTTSTVGNPASNQVPPPVPTPTPPVGGYHGSPTLVNLMAERVMPSYISRSPTSPMIWSGQSPSSRRQNPCRHGSPQALALTQSRRILDHIT